MHQDDSSKWVTVQECMGIPGFAGTAPNVRRQLEMLAAGNPLAKRKRAGIKGYEYNVSILPEAAKSYFGYGLEQSMSGGEDSDFLNDEKPSERFSKRLREAMGDESVLSFAKKCGLSDTLVGRYVKGVTSPSVDKLPQIARACGKPISWFFEEEESATFTKMDRVELLQWWEMISKSMTIRELSQVVESFKQGGKNALLSTFMQERAKVGKLSQSSINTALMLESLSPEARREILSKYGINERTGTVAPKTEPQNKAS